MNNICGLVMSEKVPTRTPGRKALRVPVQPKASEPAGRVISEQQQTHELGTLTARKNLGKPQRVPQALATAAPKTGAQRVPQPSVGAARNECDRNGSGFLHVHRVAVTPARTVLKAGIESTCAKSVLPTTRTAVRVPASEAPAARGPIAGVFRPPLGNPFWHCMTMANNRGPVARRLDMSGSPEPVERASSTASYLDAGTSRGRELWGGPSSDAIAPPAPTPASTATCSAVPADDGSSMNMRTASGSSRAGASAEVVLAARPEVPNASGAAGPATSRTGWGGFGGAGAPLLADGAGKASSLYRHEAPKASQLRTEAPPGRGVSAAVGPTPSASWRGSSMARTGLLVPGAAASSYPEMPAYGNVTDTAASPAPHASRDCYGAAAVVSAPTAGPGVAAAAWSPLGAGWDNPDRAGIAPWPAGVPEPGLQASAVSGGADEAAGSFTPRPSRGANSAQTATPLTQRAALTSSKAVASRISTAFRTPKAAGEPSLGAVTPSQPMGSVKALSQVKARRALRELVGNDTVVTPVRRSARKSNCKPAVPVSTLLEAANYCYAPNGYLP